MNKGRMLNGVINGRILLIAALGLSAIALAQSAPVGESSQYAHLLVYRHRRYAGSAMAPSIYLDDRQVARVGNGRRVSIKLSPGPHTIRSDDKSSAISLEAEPGKEYYVRIDEEAGFWKGHGRLTMLLREQGAAEYRLQQPVEEDRRIAKELTEYDVAEKAAGGMSDSKSPALTSNISSKTTGTTIKVLVSSNPDGADIEIDSDFVGNTPSSLELGAGEHLVTIKKTGYVVWERKLKVVGGEVRLNADLEKQKE